MHPSQSQQKSFFDADYLCEELIPENSFYRRFREIVSPLITDKIFEDLYCKNNGRPPISPALLAKAMLIQYYMNLSDRELERACMFDLEVKFALDLKIDERPFDHSSLGDFRERLLKSSKEKQIFDQVLQELIKKKLISKKEVQRIDSTHIIADIALPNTVVMVKKASFEILKKLNQKLPKRHAGLIKNLSREEYTSESINSNGQGRFDMEKQAERLVKFVNEAKHILKETDDLKDNEEFKKPIEVLKTILRENVTEDENNNPKELDPPKKPTNRIISPVDPDARAGAKSKFKKFFGYKTNITQEIKNQFITNMSIMAGNRRDGEATIELVTEQNEKYKLRPEKLIGDTAYGDGQYRHSLKDLGTTLVAPFKEKNPRTKAVFPKSQFKINRKKNTLTCPNGAEANPHYYDSAKSSMTFHFSMTDCKSCSMRSQCTTAREGRRTVRIFDWQEFLFKTEEYNTTEQFKKDMKLRQPIEGKFSEMKRYHGLTRAKYRGLNKVSLQCYFTAAMVNVKRWIKITTFDGVTA